MLYSRFLFFTWQFYDDRTKLKRENTRNAYNILDQEGNDHLVKAAGIVVRARGGGGVLQN
jgi:hypothetical protein